MPYNYHDLTNTVGENIHTLFPQEQTIPGVACDTFILTLSDSSVSNGKHNIHIITLKDPIVPGISSTTHNIKLKTPVVSNIYNYKGEVELYSDLENIYNPKAGDVYFVYDTKENYAWNGTEWNNLGEIINLSDYWAKKDLVFLSDSDIDEITGIASTGESFMKIFAKSDNVILDNDITLNSSITINKDFDIDLNGQTIQSHIDTPLFIVDGATLVLKNKGCINAKNCIGVVINGGKIFIYDGDYTTKDVGFVVHDTGSKIVFNGGTLTAVKGGISLASKAEAVINGGTINVSNDFALFTDNSAGHGNNTITLNDGILVGNIVSKGYEACSVYIANNDTFLMNNGSIIGNNGCGLLMRSGTVVIDGGTITSNGEAGTTGWIGNNETQMSKSAIIYHQNANYPGKENMSLTISDGIITGVDHSINVLSDEPTPNIIITGGTFNPAYPEE